MSTRTANEKQAQPAQSTPAGGGHQLRRKCACGQHTPGGGECDRCGGKRQSLRRRGAGTGARHSEAIPSVVNDVLRAPGQPLDAPTRAQMESRFDHDFSGVRVHTGGAAAESARAVDALAYTVGNRVVFGEGQYAPHTATGRGLLAHELTHVTQAGAPYSGEAITLGRPDSPAEHAAERSEATGAAAAIGGAVGPHTLHRKGGTIGGFFANIFRGIIGVIDEPDYDPATLEAYLKHLRDTKSIEDDFDSDNKARDVVEQGLFKKESSDVKRLLIEEMLSGATGDDDENAIIAILADASFPERERIADTITYAKLYDNFHGKELDLLYPLLPKMELFHPRGPEKKESYTFEDYVKKWEKDAGTSLTPLERSTLARGCVGISALSIHHQIGEIIANPDLSNCYGSFEQAWNRSREWQKTIDAGGRPEKVVIFSKRFWAGDEDFTPNPTTGKVDMSKPHPGRPGYINFDYGLYDEKTNKWWHANHCDSRYSEPGKCLDPKGNPMGAMTVFESNLQYYSRDLLDFDQQVFCVAVTSRV